MMDLSDQVFTPGMVYVALSRVKQLENVHLIAFNPQSIIVSTKCLQEINRLRHIYCTDLSQYTLPSVRSTAQRRKRTLTAVLSDTPHPKQTKVVSFGMKRKAESMNEDKQLPPTKEAALLIVPHLKFKAGTGITQCLKPGSAEYVRSWVYALYICANKCTPGDPNVRLRHPTSVHKIRRDGNCLFRALCYVITGSERQHFKLRSLIIEHLRSTEACMRLLTSLYYRAYNRAIHCTFMHGSAGYMGFNNRNTSASSPSRNKHSLIQLS